MIAFLAGTVDSLAPDSVVIDVGGVGYEVSISEDTSAGLSSIGIGNAVKLHTFTYIREGSLSLYGFLSRDDLALFRLLITVNGIGPRGGLSLLSALSADDLRFAIASGDAKMIARAPGIGKKTAERLILDLRDKISGMYPDREEDASTDPSGPAGSPAPAGTKAGDEQNPAADAVEALTALGYQRPEAVRAVKRCAQTEDTEAILREALRYL